MKRNSLFNLLAMLISLISVNAYAHDIEVQIGVKTIYLKYINNHTELAVTYRGERYDTDANEYSGEIIIPESVDDYPVTSIGESAFRGCTGLTSITIPQKVTTIKAGSFYDCSGLTSVTIPNSVTLLDAQAFRGCTSLTSITIPSSVTHFGGLVFGECSNLTSVIVEAETPIENAEGSFANKNNATLYVPIGSINAYQNAVEWKDFGTIIEGYEGCTFTAQTTEGLNMVFTVLDVVGEKTCQVGYLDGNYDKPAVDREAVNGAVTIPQTVNGFTVVKIGNCALRSVHKMTSLTIPNTVTAIGSEAFADCSRLTSFELPASVTWIGGWALRNLGVSTVANVSISVAADNPIFDSRDNCNAIIETATNKLRFGCKNTIIPATVTGIGGGAFGYFSNYTLTIPSSITTIDDYAFRRGNNLTLQVEQSDPLEINENVFESLQNSTLRVPDGKKADYAAATGWKNFDNIFQGNEGTTFTAQVGDWDMVFTILDNTEKTCQVGYLDGNHDKPAVDRDAINGAVTIHSTVINSDDTYKVVKIGKYAFDNAHLMTSVTIPATVTSIDENAFYNCGLTSFELPAGVDSVGNRALSFGSVTSLKVAEGNIKFDSRGDCNAIIKTATNKLLFGCKNTKIPASVKEIGNDAFCLHNCSFFIPSTVEKIDDNAFNFCSNLFLQVEHTTPLVISENVFENLQNSTLHVPLGSQNAYAAATGWNSFGTIEEGYEGYTFTAQTEDGWDMVFTILDNTAKTCQVGYLDGNYDKSAVNRDAVEGAVTIPGSVNGYTVVKIGKYAFDNTIKMTSVTIPESVTSIDENAFFNCNGLTSFELPANVESLGNRALSSLRSVEFLKVAEGNTVYDSRGDCNAIIETATNKLLFGSKITTIPADVTEIGESAFENLDNYTLTIPSTVTTIDDNAFNICANLTLQVEHTTPLVISENVFENLQNSTLQVPAGSMGVYEAADYWNVFQVKIEYIEFAIPKVKEACLAKWDTNGDRVFSVEEAAAVESLIDYEDANDKFAELLLDPDFTSFDEFQYFTSVTSVTPEAQFAVFYNCKHLTSIILPNSITSIGINAFKDCPLTSIHIPASVTEIQMGGSFNSKYLQTITVDPTNPNYASPEGSNAIIDKGSTVLILGCGNTDFTKIPSTVTTIGRYAFGFAVFPESKTSITLPTTVTRILCEAFEQSNITSINLEDLTGLTTLGDFAFTGCMGLTEVTIPASITNRSESLNGIGMGKCVFYECTNIVKVISKIAEPFEISDDMNHDFNFCTNNAVLYVPQGKVQDYINKGWEEVDGELKSFRMIVDGDSTDPEAIEGLVYNGKDQKLILPGTYSDGMMEYSLDNETYGTSVPTGKNAGNYTIYYREVDAESDPLSLTASIATKTVSSPTITLSETSYIYDGTAQKPTVTVMDGDTEIPTEEYIVNYSDNINVGTATVTITNNTGGNYIVSGSTSFNIVREISVFIGSNLWAGYVAAEDLAIPTGLEAYVITNLGTTTATASPLDYIPQGEPVLLKRDDTTISSYEAMPGTGTAPTMNLLKAYDTDKSLSNREGFILYNDEFVLVNEGTLPAGRVFLPANNALLSRGLTRSIEIDDDNATGIEDNKMFVDDADGQWFDLQGRRLEKKPTKKGLYILKGRKVIVK